jgi:hypothetical protein
VDALPSGSYLVVNDGIRTTEESVQGARIANEAGVLYQLRTRDEIAGFLQGLELVEPGVVAASRWRPEPDATDTHVEQATAGVGANRSAGSSPSSSTRPFAPSGRRSRPSGRSGPTSGKAGPRDYARTPGGHRGMTAVAVG